MISYFAITTVCVVSWTADCGAVLPHFPGSGGRGESLRHKRPMRLKSQMPCTMQTFEAGYVSSRNILHPLFRSAPLDKRLDHVGS
jgi:hypothetical protein